MASGWPKGRVIVMDIIEGTIGFVRGRGRKRKCDAHQINGVLVTEWLTEDLSVSRPRTGGRRTICGALAPSPTPSKCCCGRRAGCEPSSSLGRLKTPPSFFQRTPPLPRSMRLWPRWKVRQGEDAPRLLGAGIPPLSLCHPSLTDITQRERDPHKEFVRSGADWPRIARAGCPNLI